MTEYVVGELEEARFRQCNGDGQDSRNTLRDAKASNSVARVQMGNIFFIISCVSFWLCSVFTSLLCSRRVSHCGGFCCCGAQALGCTGFNSVVPGLQKTSCGTQVQLVHGVQDCLDQGSNSCLLHWQVDSLPLHHQESPRSEIFKHYVKIKIVLSAGITGNYTSRD